MGSTLQNKRRLCFYNKTRARKTLFGCFLLLGYLTNAQDALFLFPLQNQVYTQPSFAGFGDGPRYQHLTTLYNTKSNDIFIYSYTAADCYFKRTRSGLGLAHQLVALNGVFQQNQISATWTQRLIAKNKKLMVIPSLMATYTNKRLAGGQFAEPPELVRERNVKNTAGLDAGILLRYSRLCVAFRSNLLREYPRQQLLKQNLQRGAFYLGYNLPVNKAILLNAYIRTTSNSSAGNNQVGLNALILGGCYAGVAFANNKMLLFAAGYRWQGITVALGTNQQMGFPNRQSFRGITFMLSWLLRGDNNSTDRTVLFETL